MARIAGVNLPNQKRLEIGLTYIYGIGRSTSQKVLAELGLSLDTKVKDLTDEEVTKLREYIDQNLEVEGDLVGQGALDVEGNSAPASGDRPVQMAHEHVIGLSRAGDDVPFRLAIGELDRIHVAQAAVERRMVLEQQ